MHSKTVEVNATPIIDKLTQQRRTYTWLLFIGMGIQGVSYIILSFQGLGHLHSSRHAATLQNVQMLGRLIWIAAFFWMYRSGQLAKQYPSTARRLEDDFYREVRTKAALVAGGVLVACQLIMPIIDKHHPISVETSSNTSILIAVLTLFAVTLYLDRDF